MSRLAGNFHCPLHTPSTKIPPPASGFYPPFIKQLYTVYERRYKLYKKRSKTDGQRSESYKNTTTPAWTTVPEGRFCGQCNRIFRRGAGIPVRAGVFFCSPGRITGPPRRFFYTPQRVVYTAQINDDMRCIKLASVTEHTSYAVYKNLITAYNPGTRYREGAP
jgi:hypothetical protein